MPDAMKRRVSDEEVARHVTLAERAERNGWPLDWPLRYALDLHNARAESKRMYDWLDLKAHALARALGHSGETQVPPMDAMIAEAERLRDVARAAGAYDDASLAVANGDDADLGTAAFLLREALRVAEAAKENR